MVAVSTSVQNDLSEVKVWKPVAHSTYMLRVCGRFSLLMTNSQLLFWPKKMLSELGNRIISRWDQRLRELWRGIRSALPMSASLQWLNWVCCLVFFAQVVGIVNLLHPLKYAGKLYFKCPFPQCPQNPQRISHNLQISWPTYRALDLVMTTAYRD